jgi:hypothetical protein
MELAPIEWVASFPTLVRELQLERRHLVFILTALDARIGEKGTDLYYYQRWVGMATRSQVRGTPAGFTFFDELEARTAAEIVRKEMRRDPLRKPREEDGSVLRFRLSRDRSSGSIDKDDQ